MDKHRICKICNRRFANGKAMGGHMRSHFARLPISSSNINPSPPKYPSSSSSLSNMQTYRSVNNRPFSGLEDESEAESSRNLTKARSKRPRRTIESVSNSVTENILSDREVAMCLLKLSRDNWLQKDKQVAVSEAVVDEDEYIRDESDDNDDEEEDEEEDESSLVTRTNKYKCKTCKKEFRSYQALGGHKASHKKIKIHHNGSGAAAAAAAGDAVVMDQRVFKCPFCDKVFDSGQALGGHKKIHFTYLATPITKITSAKSSGAKFIDLNLPAPEDDSEVSQV